MDATTETSAAFVGGDDGIARLQSRARNAEYAIYTYVGMAAVMMAFELLELAGVVDLASLAPSPLEAIYGLVAIGFLVVFVVSVVLISMWIYRAHANLRDRGFETESSPGWAVGWYFIPFANLIKPFQNMRDLWAESHVEADSYGGPAPGEITSWWACWIIGNILSNVSMRISNYGDGSNLAVGAALAAVASGLLIACALLLRNIIRQITQAQDTQMNVRQVFE